MKLGYVKGFVLFLQPRTHTPKGGPGDWRTERGVTKDEPEIGSRFPTTKVW